jgi:alkylation response protein AidB-like acyl-CoA dehydrogenase
MWWTLWSWRFPTTIRTADGVQLLGGNGYMKDYPEEKRMRDSKQIQNVLGMALVRKIQPNGRIVAMEMSYG